MAPKSTSFTNINLRLRNELHQKLKREADRHHFSVTNEIRIRLEDSFVRADATRTIDDVAMSMQIQWARFVARFLRIELAERLAEAVMSGRDPDELRQLAQLIIKHRADEQRQPISRGVS